MEGGVHLSAPADHSALASTQLQLLGWGPWLHMSPPHHDLATASPVLSSC